MNYDTDTNANAPYIAYLPKKWPIMTRHQLAQRVARTMVDESSVPQAIALDPATIALLLAILSALLPMLADCALSKAVAVIRRPTFIQRLRLRRIVHQEICGTPLNFRKLKGAVLAGLLSTGKQLEAWEINALLRERRCSLSEQ